MEPIDKLLKYQSTKQVLAGEIIEVVPAGCFVKNEDGSAILRIYEPAMTARRIPVVGDYWVVYPDGYQSISPKDAFLGGYILIG